MPCTFCRIVTGEVLAHVVHDDDVSLAFLDRRPLFPGHVLVIPKRHVETLPDLPSELVGPLFLRVRRLTEAVRLALDAPGAFVAVNNKVSQSVPHLHVHIAPRRPKDGLRGFFWPRTSYPDEATAAATAAAVAAAAAGLGPEFAL
ncbi:MAG: HIT family protein [Acidimicrobiales bacterium]